MRLTFLAVAAALSVCTLAGCSSSGSGPSGSGLAESFNMDNYRRSSDTNGTQTRPDVNRQFTQPSIPSIVNRGN
ncbi:MULTISPECIES: hypothetical protein [Methylobacterium]|uniref:Lipoprotein n=1 Tax=Methylobacterium thuringiense TaxID=1003091 RepID=A0ABQ4TGH9_9HYPH|nr:MULTISPECIES: hypothetical protein [Methylobacterium]TXN21250.1 hypothetical protein FV217_15045 [Methylobacterium sp. WL9]GJE53889.1 hypothetical protein EKPJFOCH_0357 [Methylobacterium thuringiense]